MCKNAPNVVLFKLYKNINLFFQLAHKLTYLLMIKVGRNITRVRNLTNHNPRLHPCSSPATFSRREPLGMPATWNPNPFPHPILRCWINKCYVICASDTSGSKMAKISNGKRTTIVFPSSPAEALCSSPNRARWTLVRSLASIPATTEIFFQFNFPLDFYCNS